MRPAMAAPAIAVLDGLITYYLSVPVIFPPEMAVAGAKSLSRRAFCRFVPFELESSLVSVLFRKISKSPPELFLKQSDPNLATRNHSVIAVPKSQWLGRLRRRFGREPSETGLDRTLRLRRLRCSILFQTIWAKLLGI